MKMNQKAVLLSFPEQPKGRETQRHQRFKQFILEDFTKESIETALNRIKENQGPVHGFIHIHPCRGAAASVQGAFVNRDYTISKAVFLAAAHLEKSLTSVPPLKKGRPCFATVTQLDGRLGTGGNAPFHFISGGLSGLTKSLGREWPGVFCRHVDIAPETDPDQAAAMIIQELSDPDSHVLETGRTAAGERCTLKPSVPIYGPAAGELPGKNTCFLVTGGGRGITGECVCEAAKAFQCRFILLGRTPLWDTEPDWCGERRDETGLQSAAIAYLKGQNKHPKPADVRRMVNAVTANREIRQTLARIRDYGGQAVYLAADITRPDDITRCFSKAGVSSAEIDGIIHGAGNLADKRIGMKTKEDFSLVFDTKVKGLETIIKRVDPERLRYLLLFSSVSGYFGNAGQTDYAMANEVLNKFAHCFRLLFPKCITRTINWGPWESGMMTKDLQALYKEKKIRLIPESVGAGFCTRELCDAGTGSPQVLICGELSVPVHEKKRDMAPVRIIRAIDPAKNPFLGDHVIGGSRVLPATCAMAWMVQACETCLPCTYKFKKLTDFKVLNGIRFSTPAPLSCTVEIIPHTRCEGSIDAAVKIIGRSDSDMPVYHYSAMASFAESTGPVPVFRGFEPAPDGVVPQTGTGLYGPGNFLFHGGSFMGVRQVINISDTGITTLCRLPEPEKKAQGQFPVTGFNPYTADVQLHCSLIWTQHCLLKQCLPLEFGRVEQFKTFDFNEEFYVTGKIGSHTKHNLVMDIMAHDKKGNIYFKFTRASFTFKTY